MNPDFLSCIWAYSHKQKLKRALRDKRPYTKATREQWTQHFLSMIADNNTSYQHLFPLKAAPADDATGSPGSAAAAEGLPPPPAVKMVSPIAQQDQQAAETVKRRLEEEETSETPVKRKRIRAKRSRLIPTDDIFSDI